MIDLADYDTASETYRAAEHEATMEFMAELLALFEKYGVAIVPTYEGRISFHDSMAMIPLDEATRVYVNETGVALP
jgi:hypothetical protein